MSLVDYYLPLKTLHISTVSVSVSLFTLRGAAVLAGQRWPMHRSLRMGSMLIDTVLLLAGIALWVILQLNPGVDGWFGLKLSLVVAYIVFGIFALKRAPTWRAKAACYCVALACALWAASTALAHDPAGPLRLFGWM